MRLALMRGLALFFLLWIPVQGYPQTQIDISPASVAALGISTEPVNPGSTITSATATAMVMAPPGKSQVVTLPFDATMLEPMVVTGMEVSAGQDLALLQSPDYASANAQLESLRINASHDQYLAERTLELRNIGLRSEQEADEAEHQAETALIELRAMEQRLQNIKPAEGAATFFLSSPVDGLITHVSAHSGEQVASAEPVISLFVGNSYWASAQVPETKAVNIGIGDSVDFAQSETGGVVVAVDPEIDPVSRSMEVLIELPGDVHWRVGQLVTAEFSTPVYGDALVVPTRSVVRIAGDLLVFVASENGFRAIPVEVLSESRTQAVISGDLSIGDEVAVSGLAALKNIVEGG